MTNAADIVQALRNTADAVEELAQENKDLKELVFNLADQLPNG